VDNFDAFFGDDEVVTQQPEQPTVGQDKPVPTSSVSVDEFFDSMTASPAYEEDIPDTSAPEVAEELSTFEDDDRYVDYYVKRMLPVPDNALQSGALEQTERMTRVERLSAERPEYTDEDYENIAAGMGEIIAEESKSMTGMDPVSRAIMTAAGTSGTGTKMLFGFADIMQNITAYTGDQIESFLKKAKEQQVGGYLYDLVDTAVAGGRSGKARDERELTNRIMNMAGVGLEF